MAIEGVDYAFPPHPDIAGLAAAGVQFACRYGGPGTEDKWVHADEAQALAAAGIALVANAEGSQSGLHQGFAAGASWARSADAWFKGIGMPDGRPIYFSVDFDTTTGDWDELDAAMDGAASVIGRERVGVYGEYSIVAHLIGNGKAKWAWETYAWSGGHWFSGNHIEQYRNGVQLAGADVDLNRAKQADYGQWFPVGMMTEEDMTSLDDVFRNADGNDRSLAQMIIDKFDGQYTDVYDKQFPRSVGARLAALEAKPPVQAAPVDPAALKAVLLDPQVLAAIATAVLDEDHKRSAA
jgi:hypothetical protein